MGPANIIFSFSQYVFQALQVAAIRCEHPDVLQADTSGPCSASHRDTCSCRLSRLCACCSGSRAQQSCLFSRAAARSCRAPLHAVCTQCHALSNPTCTLSHSTPQSIAAAAVLTLVPLPLVSPYVCVCVHSLISEDLRRGLVDRAEHTFQLALTLAVSCGVVVMVLMEVRQLTANFTASP
jgi:hypothetical protein